jgi:Cation transport ATPase
MIPPSCRVVRDSTILSIPAAELVKGDVVLLVRPLRFRVIGLISTSVTFIQRVGDKTPADLVVFAATDLKIDNSSLTGESEPQARFPVPDGSKARPAEAENLVRAFIINLSLIC